MGKDTHRYNLIYQKKRDKCLKISARKSHQKQEVDEPGLLILAHALITSWMSINAFARTRVMYYSLAFLDHPSYSALKTVPADCVVFVKDSGQTLLARPQDGSISSTIIRTKTRDQG